MSIRRSLLAPFLLLASACGASTSTPQVTTPEPTRRPRVLRADVTAPAFPALETRLRDDSLLIVRGGRRLLLDDDGVRAASTDFASPVLGIAEREDGFLYLTADGVGYRTEGPGPLDRPVEAFRTALRRISPLGPSRGRLVLLAGDLVGDLYVSDGGEPVRAPLPPRSVIGATFVDDARGCALLFDGTGRYTDDGGATYRVVAGLDHAYALDLHAGSCRYHVGTSEEPRYQSIDERGFAVDYEPGEEPERDAVYPYRPAELYLSRGTMARIGRSRAIALGPAITTVQVFSLDDGRLLETHEDALPSDCTLVDVGEGAVAICTPEEGESTAWSTSDGATFEPLAGLSRILEERGAQVFGSDDGQLAFTGPCEDDPAIASTDDSVCVLRDLATGAHASLMISEYGRSAIRDLAGDVILLETIASGRYWLARLGTEETWALEVEGARRILEAELASDGTLMVIAEHEGGVRAIHLGQPGGPLERREFPTDAVDASFQDAEHGVAAGRTMQNVFRTRDGGRTWAPMRIQLEGDASQTPLLDPERYLECHRTYCLGYSWRGGRGRAVVVRAMDEDTAPTTLASQGPDRLGDEPTSPLAIPTALRCSYTEGTTALERPVPAPARADVSRVYGDGRFLAWVDEVPRGRRRFVQIHWSGEDAEGRYVGSSRLSDSNAAAGTTVRTDVIGASRAGALLNVCIVRPEGIECQFAIALPDSVPILLDGTEPHIATHGRITTAYTVRDLFFTVVPRATGPMVFVFDPIAGSASSFDVGEQIGEAWVGIAESALGPYFVITDQNARLWHAMVEQSEGLGFPPFAAITDSRLSICRTDTATATVRWPGRVSMRIGDESVEGFAAAEISLSDGPACIRGFALNSDPTFAQLRSNGSGQLEGFVDRGAEGLRNVRCTLR